MATDLLEHKPKQSFQKEITNNDKEQESKGTRVSGRAPSLVSGVRCGAEGPAPCPWVFLCGLRPLGTGTGQGSGGLGPI